MLRDMFVRLVCAVRSFTGGDTGISICKKAGMIPIQMELGGKDACIVCAVRMPTLIGTL